MNREILFKAKRIDNCEWVEGYYFCAGGKYMILNFTEKICELYHNLYEVQADTICQFTGLTDKNGNKIWENDIVKLPELYGNEVGVVKYLCCAFRVRNSAYGSTQLCGEVIGNIFDNPELLKGGAEE